MKKLFNILALVSIFAIACNSNCEQTVPCTDSTAIADSSVILDTVLPEL